MVTHFSVTVSGAGESVRLEVEFPAAARESTGSEFQPGEQSTQESVSPIGFAPESYAQRAAPVSKSHRQVAECQSAPSRQHSIRIHQQSFDKSLAFLALQPPAVEGENGSRRTYEMAEKLLRDGLSEHDAFTAMALEWNPRCRPPWDHKALLDTITRASRWLLSKEAG